MFACGVQVKPNFGNHLAPQEELFVKPSRRRKMNQVSFQIPAPVGSISKGLKSGSIDQNPMLWKTVASPTSGRFAKALVRNQAISGSLIPKSQPKNRQNIMKLNVSGKIYTIDRYRVHRSHLLSPEYSHLDAYHNSVTGEYFFDRHRPSFEVILEGLERNRTIVRPTEIPIDVFLEELKFYLLDEKVLEDFLYFEGLLKEDKKHHVPEQPSRLKVFKFIHPKLFPEEMPDFWRELYKAITLMLIFMSLIIFTTESLYHHNEEVMHVLILLEEICDLWFFIEFCLHWYSAPDRGRPFLKETNTILDILALIPFFFYIGNETHRKLMQHYSSDEKILEGLKQAFNKLRILHIIRICKLGKYSRGVAVLGQTLIESREVLTMLATLQLVLAITFSSFAFYADNVFYDEVEYPKNPKYNCIDNPKLNCTAPEATLGIKAMGDAIYWSIITMTTIGYGDIVPATFFGQCIGALCAVFGILAIAFPVPIVVGNFNYLYNADTEYKLKPEDISGDPDKDCKISIKEGKLVITTKFDEKLEKINQELWWKFWIKKPKKAKHSDEITSDDSISQQIPNNCNSSYATHYLGGGGGGTNIDTIYSVPTSYTTSNPRPKPQNLPTCTSFYSNPYSKEYDTWRIGSSTKSKSKTCSHMKSKRENWLHFGIKGVSKKLRKKKPTKSGKSSVSVTTNLNFRKTRYSRPSRNNSSHSDNIILNKYKIARLNQRSTSTTMPHDMSLNTGIGLSFGLA